MDYLVRHSLRWQRWGLLAAIFTFSAPAPAQTEATDEGRIIAGHVAHFDAGGHLLPWIAWTTALEREMLFYQQSPSDHGYRVLLPRPS
jgi:hypothetical protein